MAVQTRVIGGSLFIGEDAKEWRPRLALEPDQALVVYDAIGAWLALESRGDTAE